MTTIHSIYVIIIIMIIKGNSLENWTIDWYDRMKFSRHYWFYD